MQEAVAILQKYWKHDKFRSLQYEIIDSVLSGQDTFALMPTGGGKSVCFQIPAMMNEGICLVISPLVALMKDQVANLQKDQLKIGFVPVAEMKVFPYIMPNIRAHFPQVKIHFHSMTDADQFQALHKGEIDVAFTRFANNHEAFEYIQIFQEPLVLIMPKDSPFAEQRSISIKSFEQQDFIISDPVASPQLYKIIQDFFKQNKIAVKVVQQSTNILLNVNLVGMGVGWSLVPAYVIPLLGDKIVVKNTVEPLPMIGLYASYRKDQKNEAIDLILKILKEQFYMDSEELKKNQKLEHI